MRNAMLLVVLVACKAAPTTPARVAPAVAPPPKSDPQAWRVRPQPGPARPFASPKIERRELANGVPVYVVENHAAPLVTIEVLSARGALADPKGRAGLAAFVANLLDEGAGKRDAAGIATRADELGANLATGATSEASVASIDVPMEALADALDLLRDVVRKPKLSTPDLERVRADVLGELARARDRGPTIALDVLRKVIFPVGSPRATPVAGTKEAIAAITIKDVQTFYARAWASDQLSILVVGDLTADRAVKLLEPRFGTGKRTHAATPAATTPAATTPAAKLEAPVPPPAKTRAITIVDRPSADQGDVYIGFALPPRDAPDFAAAEAAYRIWGGTYVSRLNRELRDKRGLTYVIRFALDTGHAGTYVTFGGGMTLAKTAEAVRAIYDELDRLRAAPPMADEVLAAQTAAILGLGAKLELDASIASVLRELVITKLPLDALDRYVAAVMQLDAKSIYAAAQRYFVETAPIVVVGPAATLAPQLESLGIARIVKRDVSGSVIE